MAARDRTNVFGGQLCESLEPRLMLSVDLAVAAVGVSDTSLYPGQNVTVEWTVTNTGDEPLVNPGAGWSDKIFLSADDQFDPAADTLLATKPVNIATLGPAVGYKINQLVALPTDLPAGTYHLFVQADADSATADVDRANNTASAAVDVSLTVGQFGVKDGVKLGKLTANNGATPVTFTLSGPGWGEVILGPNGWEVVLHETTTASTVKLALPRKTTTTIASISVDGALRSLGAAGVHVAHGIQIGGGTGSLTAGDVGGVIDIGASALPKLTAAVTLGNVADATLTSQVPLKSLAVAQWIDTDADVDIIAPYIGKLTSAGVFQADMDLANAGGARNGLGSVNIKGDCIDAIWAVVGNAGRITIGGAATGLDAAFQGNLSGLTTGLGLSGNLTAGTTGAIKAGGDITNFELYAGGVMGKTGLSSLTAKGQITQTSITATGNVSTISGADIAGCYVEVMGTIRTLKSLGNISGQVFANSISTLSAVNSLEDLDLMLTPPAANKQAIGTLKAGQWIDDLTLHTDGSIGSVTAGGLKNSSICFGYYGRNMFAATTSDFNPLCSAKSIKITGIAGETFSVMNSSIAGYKVGSVSLVGVQPDNGGQAFGLSGVQAGRITVVTNDKYMTWAGNGNLPAEGDFQVYAVA